jgi:two-component system response regulator PrrA
MSDQVGGIVLVVPSPRTAEDRAIEDRLRAAGLAVHPVREGPRALEEIDESEPSVIVFAPSGHDRAATWKSIPEVRRRGFAGAVLVVGPTGDPSSVVAALECGADDYVPLSCDPSELAARVRALARRTGSSPPLGRDVAGLALDLRHGVLRADGVEVTLTRREADLLDYLARNAGRPVPRAELATQIWHTRGDSGTNVVDVYVSYLRRKLGTVGRQSLIRSVRGVGYELVDTPGH